VSEPTTEVAETAAQIAAKELQAWSELLRSGMMEAVEFGKEQVPGVLQEMLRFTLFSSLLAAACFGALFAVAVRVALKNYRAGKDDYDECRKKSPWGGAMWAERYVWPVVVGSVSATFFAVAAAYHLQLAAKILFAPRVFLIERVAEILK